MNDHPPPPLPVIIGATASGKSALAIELALRLADGAVPGLGPGEVVSADSMQVYRGMDIGTAKPSPAERLGVPHHLIDIRETTEPFSVDEWLGMAEGAIADIRARGATPIVVGGSLLYAKAFLEGLFDGPPADETIRQELLQMDPRDRRRLLESIDPAAAARIHFNDIRRTVRALEVHRLTGRPISALQQQWETGGAREGSVVVGIEWPTEALNKRINARVKTMVDDGLIDEVRELWLAGRLGRQAREALGYKQFVEVFEQDPRSAEGGRRTAAIEAAIEAVKVETRRFAKNQRTWLRRLKAAHGGVWLNAAATPESEWSTSVIRGVFSGADRSNSV